MDMLVGEVMTDILNTNEAIPGATRGIPKGMKEMQFLSISIMVLKVS